MHDDMNEYSMHGYECSDTHARISGLRTLSDLLTLPVTLMPKFGMRDSRSPGVVPESGKPLNDAATGRRIRRADEKHHRYRGAALRYVLRESRRAGAVAVAAHGTLIWLKQPASRLQPVERPPARLVCLQPSEGVGAGWCQFALQSNHLAPVHSP